MKKMQIVIMIASVALLVSSAVLLSACGSSSSGSTRVYTGYSPGYRGYHRRAWGYPPVYVGGGVDPDWGVDAPVAAPLPEMGMPDFGGGMDMDFGGFDW